MDCPRPSYVPEHGIDPSESLHFCKFLLSSGSVFANRLIIVQEWKHSCYIHCLAPVLDNISQPNLNYDTVLDLDKRIRDFAIPVSLRNKDINTKSIVMQRASLSTALEAGKSHRRLLLHLSPNPLTPPFNSIAAAPPYFFHEGA